jgi:hypothetical protein
MLNTSITFILETDYKAFANYLEDLTKEASSLPFYNKEGVRIQLEKPREKNSPSTGENLIGMNALFFIGEEEDARPEYRLGQVFRFHVIPLKTFIRR